MSYWSAKKPARRGELWREIPAHPGYEVSNKGRVRNMKTGRVLRACRNNANGNLMLGLTDRGRNGTERTTCYVARLVGAAWCPDFRPELSPVYVNGDRADCRPSNLRWVTSAEVRFVPRGEAQGHARLTEQAVLAIRASNETTSALARHYGVSPSTVHGARKGHTWKHLTPDTTPQ